MLSFLSGLAPYQAICEARKRRKEKKRRKRELRKQAAAFSALPATSAGACRDSIVLAKIALKQKAALHDEADPREISACSAKSSPSESMLDAVWKRRERMLERSLSLDVALPRERRSLTLWLQFPLRAQSDTSWRRRRPKSHHGLRPTRGTKQSKGKRKGIPTA